MNDLSQKELTRAKKALSAAKALLEYQLYEDCVSRAYYAVLHAAKAVLAIEGIEPHIIFANFVFYSKKQSVYVRVSVSDNQYSSTLFDSLYNFQHISHLSDIVDVENRDAGC